MTVAIACLLPDGVILGVDSAVSVPTLDGGIAKIYENAEKIFQIGNKPIGIATYGLGSLGTRSIGSYVREFEVKHQHKTLNRDYQLSNVVEALRNFFMEYYKDTVVKNIEANGIKFDVLDIEEKPSFGLIVGGFSTKAYIPELWQLEIPKHDKPNSGVRLLINEDWTNQFGMCLFSMSDPIKRYMNGYDPFLLGEALHYIADQRKSPITQDEIKHILNVIVPKYNYQIHYGAMSIQEGINYTRFLVDMVINHYRYATGDSVVGGKSRIGKVSYKGEGFEILDA